MFSLKMAQEIANFIISYNRKSRNPRIIQPFHDITVGLYILFYQTLQIGLGAQTDPLAVVEMGIAAPSTITVMGKDRGRNAPSWLFSKKEREEGVPRSP